MPVHKSLADALSTTKAETPAPTEKESVPAPAKKTTRKAAPRATKATPPPAAPEKVEPVVKVPTANTAKRPTLYLHPEDAKELGHARVEDGIDLNGRIRAMIAVWRTDPRFRAKVDRLAREAPRGPRGPGAEAKR